MDWFTDAFVKAWLLPAVLCLAGCPGFGSKTIEDLEPVEAVPTWDDDIQPLFAEKCAFCHTGEGDCGTPDTFRLDKLRMEDEDGQKMGAFEVRDRILARVVDLNPSPMPPEGPLPGGDMQLIDVWVMAGAPRNAEAQ